MERIIGRPRFPFLVEEARPGTVLETPDYVLKAARDRARSARPGLVPGGEARVWACSIPERAVELGVTPGPDFGRLQRGESRDHAGRPGRSSPSEVMDEARPGRKIVVTGTPGPTEAVIELAHGASVLVHDSTFAESEQERALETGHSTARKPPRWLAPPASTRWCSPISARATAGASCATRPGQVFPGALLPRDLDVLVVPYPDKGTAWLERV